jgi:hypothetical protein
MVALPVLPGALPKTPPLREMTMEMYALIMEWNYATPSIYIRATLEQARETRNELAKNYPTCKRLGIYKFIPMTVQPGLFHELQEETVYPEKYSG